MLDLSFAYLHRLPLPARSAWLFRIVVSCWSWFIYNEKVILTTINRVPTIFGILEGLIFLIASIG
jgi:hypothetical protein